MGMIRVCASFLQSPPVGAGRRGGNAHGDLVLKARAGCMRAWLSLVRFEEEWNPGVWQRGNCPTNQAIPIVWMRFLRQFRSILVLLLDKSGEA